MVFNPEKFLAELEIACKGLLYMSESDFEIKPIYWKGTSLRTIDNPTVLELTGLPITTSVVTEGIDDFFRNSIIDQHWHGSKQKDDVLKFRSLIQFLKDNLRDIIVFRFGLVEIDVYVIGRSHSGDLAGIFTKVVET